MRLTRVYVDAPLGVGLLVELPEHVNGHLVRVLRLREGDPCVLFNGDGHDYEGRITNIGKRGVQAEIVSTRRIDNMTNNEFNYSLSAESNRDTENSDVALST